MIEAVSLQNDLGDPRLAALATSASAAWLWNTEATRLLWTNAVGAAILGSQNPAALIADRAAGPAHIGAQITRFSATLPYSGAARLERLRGLAAGVGRMLLCRCARIALPDCTPGFLLEALEPAGPPLTLTERVRRLVKPGEPLAVFMPDGPLLYVTAGARAVLGAADSLAALGAEALGREALILGQANGRTPCGPIQINRLGRNTATVLVAMFLAPPAALSVAADATRPDEIAEPMIAAAPVAAEPALAMEHIVPQESVLPIEPMVSSAPVPPSAAAAPDLPVDQPLEFAMLPPPVEIPSAWIPSQAPPPEQRPREAEAPVEPIRTEIKAERPLREWRHPLRFVWQMDVEGRFTLGSDEFTEVIGPNVASALGRRWDEIATELALDPEGQVARAVASRDTWSGVVVSWPVDSGTDRLKIELSGLPIYDRNRTFLGYRGFGVCRDIDRLVALSALRANADTMKVDGVDAVIDAPDSESPAKSASSTTGNNDDNRPIFTVVPAAKNVVPFRSAPGAEPRGPALGPIERNAFNELARQLSSRLQDSADDVDAARGQTLPPAAEFRPASDATIRKLGQEPDQPPQLGMFGTVDHPLLERLPVAILVYRLDQLLYANHAFLEWTGYPDLEALTEAGGLDTLFMEPSPDTLGDMGGHGRPLAIATQLGDKIPVEGRLFSVPWDGETALALVLVNTIGERAKESEHALRTAEADIATLNAVLDAITDGVILLDSAGRILSANRGAHLLLGYETDDLKGYFADLLTPESKSMALEHLAELTRGRTRGIVNTGCEVAARTRSGTLLVLMEIKRIAGDDQKFCVTLHDVSARKRIEDELLAAQRQGQKTASDKSAFLAKVSHEIRTPLNSIVGFSEVMLEERFGPIGNERYRDYLRDIRTSGTHVISMLNDLLNLSKIEAGTLELTYVPINVNELVQSAVAQMQPQAGRERIIIRMSLSPSLPAVTADMRSLRQIIVDLLGHSIKFTSAGGQVIVSTALNDAREVVLRVRDTGIGMSDKDVESALEPFRQRATRSPWSASGNGLGLSLTKALAEANRARFNIVSKVDDGTLVEVTFPPAHGLEG